MRYILITLLALSFACTSGNAKPDHDHKKVSKLKPETFFSAEIPGDVDTKKQTRLTEAGKFALVQRLFDEYSWKAFVALNWPLDDKGRPNKYLKDMGTPQWATYSESYEVFKSDGSKPDPYGEVRRSYPPINTEDDLPSVGQDILRSHKHRILYQVSALTGLNILDEVNQAFSSPLWDQNGNLVHYEVLLNKVEYDYILKNELYNLQGQVAFYKKHGKVQFPSGSYAKKVGAIELKLAWKILTDKDIESRYLTQDAAIVVGKPPQWKTVRVGLVGMHISQKSESSPQWIWSTFEHVDNLRVDAHAVFGADGASHPKVPSFNNSECEYCPTNVVPQPDAKGVRRTQVSRVVPIPKATEQYNRKMQNMLAEKQSVLQFYELVNTQWPTDPSASPAKVDSYPDNITNKSGGKPTPVFLINSTMETYFQGGASAPDSGTVQLVINKGTPITIPSTNGGNVPLEYAEGFCATIEENCSKSGHKLVLTTESCMGCHSSASIAIDVDDQGNYKFGDALLADFSWLLQQKAKPKK